MQEFQLLERVFAHNVSLPACVVVPPGDDMAALRLPPQTSTILVAADSAVEGRHTPVGVDAYILGRKAVLRNLSDVAAMANARPFATLACAMIPAGTEEARVWRLFEGLRETALQWNAPLVGGDMTAVSAESALSVAVTILATPIDSSAALATRSSAREGDGVYVTGVLGGAWDRVTGLGRHLDFTPRLNVAQALFAQLGSRLHAMIDVSDGLMQDLGHIAKRSAHTLEIELARVPIENGWAPMDAIAHGEDYELAFTATGEVPAQLAGVPITRIGTVRAGDGIVQLLDGARTVTVSRPGWEHGT